MDIRSGIPFWLATNGILADFPTLNRDLPNEEVVIIGSGISGALAAHELCSAGFQCTMIDKRMAASGSTWASTAQINYEIDNMLTDVCNRYDEQFGVAVYRSSLASVHRLQELLTETGIDASLELCQCLYLANNKKGLREIKEEYALRRKHDIPVDFLSKEELADLYRINNREGGLIHSHAAQLDSYKAAIGLINHQVKSGQLTVYTRTAITDFKAEKQGVTLDTDSGHTIRARHVVCAPGYESQMFLPQGLKYFLYSTFALATAPLSEDLFWKDCCQIWETARPYFYLRTTKDNRIIMGGQDSVFKNPFIREAMRQHKSEKLIEQFHELFPGIEIKTDFTWAGTFSFTPDGLPYIGEHPDRPNMYFALGYGGNGTTFSMIAAEMIRNKLLGKEDPRERLYSFSR